MRVEDGVKDSELVALSDCFKLVSMLVILKLCYIYILHT